ncbi:hypothetical protein ACHAW6_015053 [Cyclotella cf. meneghiniana]
MLDLASLVMLLSSSEQHPRPTNRSRPSHAASLRFLLLTIFTYSPLHSFTSCTLISSRRAKLWSFHDENCGDNSSESAPIDLTSSMQQAADEERKIRTAYFLQSSGFAPSDSTVSFLLDETGETTNATWAKESMATLEQSNRQSLLARINNQSPLDPECREYIRNLSNSWEEEWNFRQSASGAARARARAKHEERREAFLSMMRQRDALDGKNNSSVDPATNIYSQRKDGRPGFGMPYGEIKRKGIINGATEIKEVPPQKIDKNLMADAPILGRIMEEAEQRATKDAAIKNLKAQNISPEIIDNLEDITKPTHDIDEATRINTDDKQTTLNEDAKITTDDDKPSRDAPDLDRDTAEEPSLETNDLDIAAAAQRAAAAKAAQAKADERARQKRDAANKKKQEAKALAEAIMNHAEEEERLRMEKEEAEAELRRLVEEEAARWRAEEEERARLQAEEEEEAARRKTEEKERARLKAEEERKAAMRMAEEEERAKLQAEIEATEAASAAAIQHKIDDVESKMQPLTDKATGVTFTPQLDDGLYLVGVGVRRKTIINIYSVAMYASPSVLQAVSVFSSEKEKKEAQVALRDAARTFDETAPTTAFVLVMVSNADGKNIAAALADGVKPRYDGSATKLQQLESLIFEGIKSKGGQAMKGTVFRFDCSSQGVRVSVDGNERGEVLCDTMGSAFVDVFMDDKAISPKLVESCIETWCESAL